MIPRTESPHADHQVFVEITTQTIGGGADALLCCVGAELRDVLGCGEVAYIGIAVREQDDARNGRLSGIGEQ